MNQVNAAMIAADPLRMYIMTLQKGRNISQEALAMQAGISPRTYTAWMRGETKSIKEQVARALIIALDGSSEHYAMLSRISGPEARDLAEEWLRLSPEERETHNENAQKLRRVIELADDEPEQLVTIIESLRNQVRGDPAILDWISGYLAGRATRPPGE